MASLDLHADFGTASAAKRGRNPKLPYVPIIKYPTVYGQQTEQIRKRAFATREEAVACAQRVIDNRIALHERDLVLPGRRSHRERNGFPRELVGCRVTTTDPGANGSRPVGVVVAATPAEMDEGAAALGVPRYDTKLDIRWCSLVEWPDGRRWHRPEDIRIVRIERSPVSDPGRQGDRR